MKNTITVTIPFSYKGENFAPSAIIDLNTFCHQDQGLESLYHVVATENGIDLYSYEYEVLQSSPISFGAACGEAAQFLSDEQFNWEAFHQYLNEKQVLETLQTIVTDTLQIENLSEHKALKTALIRAYQAGQEG